MEVNQPTKASSIISTSNISFLMRVSPVAVGNKPETSIDTNLCSLCFPRRSRGSFL